MPIRFTSRLSLMSVIDSLNGRRAEVYEAIKTWDPAKHGQGPSIEDLARLLNRKESSICGRLGELQSSGAVAPGPMKMNRTGKPAMTYLALVYQEEPSARYSVSKDGQMDFFQAMKRPCNASA